MRRMAIAMVLAVAGCGGATGPDGGALDSSTTDQAMLGRDLSGPQPDLAPAPGDDMASSPDLTTLPDDLAVPDDLTTPPSDDMTQIAGDGSAPADLTLPGDMTMLSDDLSTLPDLTVVPDLTAPTCVDNIKNQDETDIDCGGAKCPKCGDGKMCAVVGDCTSGVCTNGVCAAASCVDKVKNGTETDIDCGGGKCPTCGAGKACGGPLDCADGICTANVCVAATCMDKVKNGLETDIDCGGGKCPMCVDGKACVANGDCAGGVCINKVCASPSCSDMVKDGAETDVDCGGGKCAPCAAGKACVNASDCGSDVCIKGVCAAASCKDGVKNEGETDVDCGGPNCGKCMIGKTCANGKDCLSSFCQQDGTCQFAQSCVALVLGQNGIGSGDYPIDPDGNGPIAPFHAYCDMISDGGGWALAAKIDGTKQTWIYAAKVWTDATTFGPNDPSATEAKTGVFNSMPFTTARVVMVDGGMDRGGKVTPAGIKLGATLSSVFGDGVFLSTSLTRPGWLALLASGSLQTHCGHEGFNDQVPGQAMRLGIFGNQENDCNSCDSFIGLGHNNQASANFAAAQWDDSGAGGRATKTFSYLWVR